MKRTIEPLVFKFILKVVKIKFITIKQFPFKMTLCLFTYIIIMYYIMILRMIYYNYALYYNDKLFYIISI